MSIEIINNTKNKISLKAIKKSVEKFFEKYKISEVHVAIHIVGSVKIRKLNKTFRKIDRTTDILSFPQVKNLDEFRNSKIPTPSFGDIFICYDVCQKQATEYNRTPEAELLFLIEHGLKHLIGKHHK